MTAKTALQWSVAAALFLGAAGMVCAETKVAFIDLDKAFNELDKTKEAHAKVEATKEEFREEIEKMNEELRTLLEEQDAIAEEALDPALSEEIRKARREEGEVKAVEISEFRSKKNAASEARRKQLQNQLLRMRQDIIDDLVLAAQDYARDEGYTMVMDLSGMSINQVPLILYHDPKFDITDAVIAIVNGKE